MGTVPVRVHVPRPVPPPVFAHAPKVIVPTLIADSTTLGSVPQVPAPAVYGPHSCSVTAPVGSVAPARVIVSVSAAAVPIVAVDGLAAVLIPGSASAWMSPPVIWLSRLPTEPPSARSHLMWYGPPLM